MLRCSLITPGVTALGMAVLLAACGDGTATSSRTADEGGGVAPGEAVETTTGADEPAAAAAPGTGLDLGEPLGHPERYYGLYANPETPHRTWFVTAAKRPEYAEQAPEIPPGYLMLGAAFGDVAPWTLRTLSETEFEQSWVSDAQPDPVSVEFELGPGGDAVAMTFTDEMFGGEGRLERTGDLPEEWR